MSGTSTSLKLVVQRPPIAPIIVVVLTAFVAWIATFAPDVPVEVLLPPHVDVLVWIATGVLAGGAILLVQGKRERIVTGILLSGSAILAVIRGPTGVGSFLGAAPVTAVTGVTLLIVGVFGSDE